MGSEVSKDYAIPSITSAFVPNDPLGHSLLLYAFPVTEGGPATFTFVGAGFVKVLGLFRQAVSLLRAASSLRACFQLCLGKSEAGSDLG